MIFFTQRQAEVAAKADVWYLDATFKVVRRPFYQLFSGHCFISKDGGAKQVPVFFALMSRRRATDYRKVLRRVKRRIGATPGVVVTDYEVGEC